MEFYQKHATPQSRAILSRNANLVAVNKVILHIKYQSSRSSDYRQDNFVPYIESM